MSILHEILQWTQGLPAWQSDAVARLLTKQNLSPEDLDDLYSMLKTAHGIPDPSGRTPNRLTADQIPAPVTTSTRVALLSSNFRLALCPCLPRRGGRLLLCALWTRHL